MTKTLNASISAAVAAILALSNAPAQAAPYVSHSGFDLSAGGDAQVIKVRRGRGARRRHYRRQELRGPQNPRPRRTAAAAPTTAWVTMWATTRAADVVGGAEVPMTIKAVARAERVEARMTALAMTRATIKAVGAVAGGAVPMTAPATTAAGTRAGAVSTDPIIPEVKHGRAARR